MNYIEKYPIIMIVVGILGISVSSILVRYSAAPSALTAAWRLLWTVALMTPVVLGKASVRKEMKALDRKTVLLSILSGLFLAVHFAVWFESLRHTSVASSTTIVCTEVIWVSLGYCLFLKGKLSLKAVLSICVTLAGSVVIALADSSVGQTQLYGDILALEAAVAVAVYTLLGRIVRGTTSTTVYTYIVYCACAAVLIIVCMINSDGFFASGKVKKALVIGAERISKILDWEDRSTCVIFGDGAGAVLVTCCEESGAAVMHSDGASGDALQCTTGGKLSMDGQKVFRFALTRVPEVVEELLDKLNMKKEEVDLFLLHQANIRIIEAVIKRLGLPAEKVPTNIERMGNTSSASLPILIDELNRNGILKPGMKMVMAGFGAGLTWGAGYIRI